MLILDAEIYFNLPNENFQGLSNDIVNDNIIRPAINFGNNLLFSGTIRGDKKIKKFIRGETYRVLIEMPTVEDEAYEAIRDYAKVGNIFLLQVASKVIGNGKILDSDYQ